jgi:hypothetical protein
LNHKCDEQLLSVSMPTDRVKHLLALHGYSKQFWKALKKEMRKAGFQYPKTEAEAFVSRVENGNLVHELYQKV